MTSRLLAATILALACIATEAESQQPAPCASAEYRQFDFWIGEWDVHRPDGQAVGRNRISREFGSCVLHEQYTTERGYAGASFNTFDRVRQRWHQTWVDNGGLLLQLDGGLRDGKMVMEGDGVGSDGSPLRHRISWTPIAADSVRQLWESRGADGKWTVAFDGLYVRRADSRK